jgi:hypothetical protein
MIAGFVCYTIGVICSVYYGLWKLLFLPAQTLLVAVLEGSLALPLFVGCVIKILFSTTITGLIWCLGYIAYNYFKGNEDPDWDAIEEERQIL